jgi:hypothetical protein
MDWMTAHNAALDACNGTCTITIAWCTFHCTRS